MSFPVSEEYLRNKISEFSRKEELASKLIRKARKLILKAREIRNDAVEKKFEGFRMARKTSLNKRMKLKKMCKEIEEECQENHYWRTISRRRKSN